MKKFIPIIGFCLVFIWMLLIFFFSSKTAEDINGITSVIANRLINIFNGENFINFTLEKQNIIINNVKLVIAKIAHFIEYAILCLFCFLMLINLVKYNLRYYLSLLICIVYAISDECHQIISSGRTPRVFDVFIDSLGAITMLIIIRLFISIYESRRIGIKND